MKIKYSNRLLLIDKRSQKIVRSPGLTEGMGRTSIRLHIRLLESNVKIRGKIKQVKRKSDHLSFVPVKYVLETATDEEIIAILSENKSTFCTIQLV